MNPLLVFTETNPQTPRPMSVKPSGLADQGSRSAPGQRRPPGEARIGRSQGGCRCTRPNKGKYHFRVPLLRHSPASTWVCLFGVLLFRGLEGKPRGTLFLPFAFCWGGRGVPITKKHTHTFVQLQPPNLKTPGSKATKFAERGLFEPQEVSHLHHVGVLRWCFLFFIPSPLTDPNQALVFWLIWRKPGGGVRQEEDTRRCSGFGVGLERTPYVLLCPWPWPGMEPQKWHPALASSGVDFRFHVFGGTMLSV